MKIETFSMDYYDNVIDIWKRTGIALGPSDEREGILRMLERNPNLFLIGMIHGKLTDISVTPATRIS